MVPCYNEEEMLDYSSEALKDKLNSLIEKKVISNKSFILFVDDGSKDDTWNKINRYSIVDNQFRGIKLSRNQGHQNALLAGLMTAIDQCDMAISIDADLQDDINCMDTMITEFYAGNDIVYGVRDNRDSDSFFKKASAELYYKLLKVLGADIVFNHADFRLMSNVALKGLSEYSEVNLFLRGLVPMIGYKSSSVYYSRKERLAGESKYPLKKMLFFGFEGVTSLSVSLLRGITILGTLITILSLFSLIYIFYKHISGQTVTGWSSLILSIWFLGGLNLFSLGIIGEYLGKNYLETKKRPRYIIESFTKEKGE